MSTRPVPTNLDSWPGVTDLVGSYKHMLHVLWSSPPSLVNVVGVGRPGVIERLTGATRLDEPVVLEALRELDRLSKIPAAAADQVHQYERYMTLQILDSHYREHLAALRAVVDRIDQLVARVRRRLTRCPARAPVLAWSPPAQPVRRAARPVPATDSS